MTTNTPSDLVKRLRDPVMMKRWWDQYGMDAADRIEQLERERDGWKEREAQAHRLLDIAERELAEARLLLRWR